MNSIENFTIEDINNEMEILEPFEKDLLNTDDLENSEINLEEHDNVGADFDPGNCATQ